MEAVERARRGEKKRGAGRRDRLFETKVLNVEGMSASTVVGREGGQRFHSKSYAPCRSWESTRFNVGIVDVSAVFRAIVSEWKRQVWVVDIPMSRRATARPVNWPPIGTYISMEYAYGAHA